MKYTGKWVVSLLMGSLTLGAASMSAQALTLNYKGFYDRMKPLYQGEINQLTLGFYFNHRLEKRPCEIKSGFIQGRYGKLPLLVSDEQQLLLPYDINLRNNSATITVELEDEPQCDFAMQIQAQLWGQTHYTKPQLVELQQQMNLLMEEYAGVGFGWMQPKVVGLTFNFDGKEAVEVKPESLPDDAVLDFDTAPTRISPLM
ncbi:DUF2987 domain-containing protein [Ferrimonas aestuarii]|uniref:DUF2987 domain-containing protein n=1 Tax=Ferrimonas aestuarii TaxID=2569539 RepID=A0A4U1BR29_9GAMM|nr:DUF2987 domain-containing protein [Ferrimonas aestuarii]TKB57274.1 DUF2987 domain-containing protein [Ferrimonas aestuarii]